MIRTSRLISMSGLSVLVLFPAAGAKWRITSVEEIAALGEPIIAVLADGAISGSTGCNRFQAGADVEPGGLVIDGPVATPRMACPGDALTFQEESIIGLLQERIGLTHDPFRLEMILARGGASMRLAAVATSGQVPAGAVPHDKNKSSSSEALGFHRPLIAIGRGRIVGRR